MDLRSSMIFLCIVYVVVITGRIKAESTFDAKARLERLLINDYSREARPIVNAGDNVTITVGMSLYLIKNMDDKNQMLTTNLWIRQTWNDPRLTWDPSNYSRVESTHLPADKVWVPDIKVYNEVNRGLHSGLDQFQTRVLIDYHGNVKWLGPIVLRTSCQVDIKLFPFDTQTCRMKVGSWTYDGFAVDIQPESYKMDVSKSPSNLEWELVTTSVERNVQVYPCCPEPYPDVTYSMTIKRREQSFGLNLIFPAAFMTAVTLMAFVTSGERIGLVLTCLVSMFFFLKMIAEKTPPSDTIPLLSIYFVTLSFEVAVTFYSVCIVLNAQHRHPSLGDMPRLMRSLVMERLGRIWGLNKVQEKMKQRLHSLQIFAKAENSNYENTEVDLSGTDNHSNFKVQRIQHKLCHNDSPLRFKELGGRNHEFEKTTSLEKECTTLDAGFVNSRAKELLKTVFLNEQKVQMVPGVFHHSQCRNCQMKCVTRNCFTFFNEMIARNQRLTSRVQEVNLLARQLDKKFSLKEQWLVAAEILDKTFLVLFMTLFVILTVINFVL